ncbi:leukocyte elastase inhibitor-like [Uloborus diversus]|uniref:leukocyte elastase inhibitor-like n=1 Tax=Uloborus diversus TaxID=327109 RepID=UPI0024099B17|nr:leukocyte elastase inhibitor-like [Uloborus diversus]
MADIFELLNELHRKQQGQGENLVTFMDKLHGFKSNIQLWREVDRGSLDIFKWTVNMACEGNRMEEKLLNVVAEHLVMLQDKFEHYFKNTNRGLNISRSYDLAIRSLYSSALKEVDFHNDSLSSFNTVNAWVRQKTKGKIRAVLQRNINLLTKMLLVNAVHFKGQWKWQFDIQATEPFGHFYVLPHVRTEVPIMTGKMHLAYGHSPKIRASILELPFTQNRLSMFLILPDSPTEVLELNMTAMKMLIGSMKKHDVNVRLPRFSIDKSPQLASLLWHLGIKDLFSPNEADLSGIAENLFVSGMIHRALIHVDEHGSIASASTLVLVERVGNVDEHYFEANRPFTFAIMDKQAGAVLFMGRIAKL